MGKKAADLMEKVVVKNQKKSLVTNPLQTANVVMTQTLSLKRQ